MHLFADQLTIVICVTPFLVEQASPKSQMWAIAVGFFSGIGLFIILGILFPEEDDDDSDDDDSDAGSEKSDDGNSPRKHIYRQSSKRKMCKKADEHSGSCETGDIVRTFFGCSQSL